MADKKNEANRKIIADNRKARFNYEILDAFEAGIALTGTEVKSLRVGKATIGDSYAGPSGDDLLLFNADIPEYLQANRFNHERKRPRKLLLHRRQINKLIGAVQRDGPDDRADEALFQRSAAAPRSSWRWRAARRWATSARPRRSATGTARRAACCATRADATMYQPPHFVEERRDVILGLIRDHPLATIVTAIDGVLAANHIPMLMDADREPCGVLRAHVARANELARLPAGTTALAIFQGPDAYVTPSWYATKRETGKVVPTWNYAVVHAHGTLRLLDDATWLRRQIGDLTDRHEDDRRDRWHVEDAPEDYVRAQIKGIVGIELDVARIEAKWKVSQNRPPADRTGVAAGLREDQGEESAMAGLVEAFGRPR